MIATKLAKTATFLTGAVVGAAMVYLAPPADTVAPRGVPGHGEVSRPGGEGPGAPPEHGASPVEGDLAPADGAKGPPVPEGPANPEVPGPEASGVDRPLDWVEQHLVRAGDFWQQQAQAWEVLEDPSIELLIRDAYAMNELVPSMGELAPPLPEVVILVSAELRLYDRAKEQGLDVSAIELELADFLDGRH